MAHVVFADAPIHHHGMNSTAPLDRIGRRSRFRRTPLGKHLDLTARDMAILRWLYRYRYLRQDHLVALMRPKSEKRLIERLGDLFHETGYINRPLARPQRFDARSSPMLYEISNSGIACLAAHSALPPRAVTFSRRARGAYNPQFLHTMMIIDALLSIEIDAMNRPGQRFVPVDEILARAPDITRHARNPLAAPVTIHPSQDHPVIRSRMETHIIPDALYGIEYLIDGEKRYRFWALECERTSPASRSTARHSSRALKQAAYDALIASGSFRRHWGIPNLGIRFCTPAKGLEAA